MDVMGSIVLTIAVAFVAGGAQYALAERFGRPAWRRLVRGARVVDGPDGPYRASTSVESLAYDEAPRFVRAVACASFYVGQMFVPGLLLGLFGLLAMGLGIVSIPGLVVAARIWRVAPKLLAPDARTAEQAEGAARWATALNVPILVGAVAASLYGLLQPDDSWLVVGGPTALYAMLSLAHAHLLKRAAAVVREAQRETDAWAYAATRGAQPTFAHARGAAPYGEGAPAGDDGAPNFATRASHTTFGA